MSRRPRSRRGRSRRPKSDRPDSGRPQNPDAPPQNAHRGPNNHSRRPGPPRGEGAPDGGDPHRPKKSLGQNFLEDPGYRARIVEEARVGPGETVVEIGPGQGALTEGLVREVAEKGGHLVLIELDDDLSEGLAARYRNDPRVTVVHGDVLDQPIAEVVPAEAEGPIKVVGNIPYNITTPILFHLLERPRPTEILLMVQREVADRILAAPGNGEYGALSVGVQAVASIERVLQVPAGAFRPRPQVDSTVIRVIPHDPPTLTAEEEGRLRGIVRAAFQWRRKQLGTILREHADLRRPVAVGVAGREEEDDRRPDVEGLLAAAGVRAEQRPEEVSPEGFIAMARWLERTDSGGE